nr:hypothetical protein [Tanacetum cinerariifolium]
VDCLPNEEIFAKLARMGYEKPSIKLTFYKAFLLAQWKFLIHTILQCMSEKRTVWKEFSSFMASAVICLATGRKFKISKYIFDSLVRNMDRPSKFLMYPRFLQLMINAQVGDLSSHTTKYTSPALTQKVFANIRRVGKGFFGMGTPLFDETSTPLVIVHSEVKSKDKGKGILIEEPKPLKRQAQIEQDEAFDRHLEAELNANINWNDVVDQLVQERFQSLEPKNFSDDFLLNTLKTMFEKPNVEANIWREQKGIYGLANVKSWKLFESCRVHIITFKTTQMFLLVERKYPLTRFTLKQMLNNVRLEVEEESEMSLELLRLVRRHLQEGYILE